MPIARLRATALLLVGSLGAAACSNGYGYGGMAVAYNSPGYCNPQWGDCYGAGYDGYGAYDGDPWWGWYGDYYYPGIGFYVYDHGGHRHRWSDRTRHYWEGRRAHYQGRDWNDGRWQRWDGYRNRDGQAADRQAGNGEHWRGRTRNSQAAGDQAPNRERGSGNRGGGGWNHGRNSDDGSNPGRATGSQGGRWNRGSTDNGNWSRGNRGRPRP